MPDINYYSPAGGGFRAEIPGVSGREGAGAGAGAGFGGPPNMDWLFALAQKSAQNKLAMQQQELLRGKQDYNLRAEDAGFSREQRRRAPFERQQQNTAQSRAQGTAEYKQQEAKRAALNALLSRNYPGMSAQGNRPGTGGLADYYEYGAGNPQGRGGGGSVASGPGEFDTVKLALASQRPTNWGRG